MFHRTYCSLRAWCDLESKLSLRFSGVYRSRRAKNTFNKPGCSAFNFLRSRVFVLSPSVKARRMEKAASGDESPVGALMCRAKPGSFSKIQAGNQSPVGDGSKS